MPIITGRVLECTHTYTDGWKACDSLVLKGCEHHRIHRHQIQFACGKNHINGIESFWSYAIFGFLKLRGVRQERSLLHVKEYEWRVKDRRANLYPLLLSLLRQNPLSAA